MKPSKPKCCQKQDKVAPVACKLATHGLRFLRCRNTESCEIFFFSLDLSCLVLPSFVASYSFQPCSVVLCTVRAVLRTPSRFVQYISSIGALGRVECDAAGKIALYLEPWWRDLLYFPTPTPVPLFCYDFGFFCLVHSTFDDGTHRTNL